MSADISSVSDSPPIAPPIGHRVTTGFIWTTGGIIAAKIANLLAQLVLARILSKEDFGEVSLALTLSVFAGLIRDAGIGRVLVHRANFGRWSNAGFWMSLGLGLLAGLLLMAAAPIAGMIFHSKVLVGLLLVLAAASPISALGTVPSAQLQVQLRFKALSAIGAVNALAGAAFTVLFAWLGFGPYSLILPNLIVAVISAFLFWSTVRPNVIGKLQLRRWKYLFQDSSILLVASFFLALSSNGDYLIVGLFRPKPVLGVYFFAFSLSTQLLQLLMASLSGLLFPAFSHLKAEPARQYQAFVRSVTVMVFSAAPLCLLQAALAGPIIRCFFGSRWIDAIPVLRALSIGLAAALTYAPANSFIQAQGRFKFFLWFSAGGSVIYLACVAVGAMLGDALSVSVGAATALSIMGPAGTWVAIRPFQRGWQEVWKIHGVPLLLSAGAILPIVAIWQLVPPFRGRDWAEIAAVLTASMSLYVLFVWMFRRSIYLEVREIILRLARPHMAV